MKTQTLIIRLTTPADDDLRAWYQFIDRAEVGNVSREVKRVLRRGLQTAETATPTQDFSEVLKDIPTLAQFRTMLDAALASVSLVQSVSAADEDADDWFSALANDDM